MAVTSIAAAGLALAGASAGYQVSENEAAKDQAKKERRKQEAEAAQAQENMKLEKQQARDKEIQTALSAANRARQRPVYNPSGIQGTVRAQATPDLSSVIGSTGNMGQRTLIGG